MWYDLVVEICTTGILYSSFLDLDGNSMPPIQQSLLGGCCSCLEGDRAGVMDFLRFVPFLVPILLPFCVAFTLVLYQDIEDQIIFWPTSYYFSVILALFFIFVFVIGELIPLSVFFIPCNLSLFAQEKKKN
jgi:uncharacterized membrane protein YciS (DUF1049 family)